MTGEGVVLRNGCEHDVEQLHQLEQVCFDAPWTRAQLRDALVHPASTALVADRGAGRLVGYCIFAVAADECEVHSMGVHPRWRCRGMGRRLLAHVLNEVSGVAARVWLEVRRGNVAARAMYRGCGFQESGMRRGYYGDGEDAVLMTRALP